MTICGSCLKSSHSCSFLCPVFTNLCMITKCSFVSLIAKHATILPYSICGKKQKSLAMLCKESDVMVNISCSFKKYLFGKCSFI